MNKVIYTFVFGALLLGAFSLMPSKAMAQCQQLYGGGETCPPSFNFSIEKLVQTPGKGGGSFVNNLSINDAKYAPAQTVSFQIVVKNTGSEKIPSLTVTDTFPQFISFVSGPGSFDTNSKTLTFVVNNLESGKSQTFTVVGKVADSNMLPSDQGIVCLVNQATGTDSNGGSNSSSAQFCVEKTVLGTSTPKVFGAPKISKTPATGAEMFSLLALIPGGLGGLILRKKSLSK
jgi:uncharacterized repeat protein (TIGR01451 family)